ncbi:MAG: hypothetical protein ACLP7W_02705 [Solirubrobacteraceae bacterium]
MAVFMWVGISPGTQAASAAQVFYSSQSSARTTARAPSRSPAKGPARAPTPTHTQPPANNAPPSKNAPAKGPARAPSKPPLSTGGSGTTPEEEASASVSQSGGDPLVANGLGSHLCRDGLEGELSSHAARDCRISGFEAGQAPTGNYGFDVHINTGVTDVANDLDVYILNPVQWSWTLLVSVVHAVIVVLEWCYTIDLFETSQIGSIARGLRETQASFTQPWLVLALAIAAVFALYHGIVRRRVAQTLGEVALMALMMMGGLWVIVNPLGTIGALDGWANEASLGTLASVATGSPAHSGRTFEESMRSIFRGAIGGPWCFMEFGDVGWCESKHLDPQLAAAARQIATKERAKIGSQGVELLNGARTNGELFLALPANGPQRNSINESGSLFNALCGGSEEPCHGPTASEAEFRTGDGTLWRVLGLCLFWVGVLGMVSVLGFIALRLLTAALFSLFFLLFAPAAVIAPALGDGGRAAFRAWATRLLGAVCAKLIYSFLLGVVLLMQRTLLEVHTFGWAAQWLLVSMMWWWLYLKRHQVDGFAKNGHRGLHQHEHRSLLRRARERAQQPPEVVRAGKWVKDKLRTPPPSVERRRKLAQAGLKRAQGIADGQVKRMLESEHREAHALVQAAPQTEARISAKRAQLEQMQGEHATAQMEAAEAKSARESALSDPTVYAYSERKRAADRFGVEEEAHRQRAVELQGHMGRLRGEIAGDRDSLAAARQTVQDGTRAQSATGNVYTRTRAKQGARLLDEQAALPPGERDYAGMAGVVGYGRRRYEALDDRGQEAVRREIDSELAVRKGLDVAAREVAASGEGSLKGREQQKANKQFDGSLEREVQEEGHELPSSLKPPSRRPKPDVPQHDRRGGGRSNGVPSAPRPGGESSVMRDVHDVAAGRKRQLGWERRR